MPRRTEIAYLAPSRYAVRWPGASASGVTRRPAAARSRENSTVWLVR
jgi:hypothetical protein